MQTLTLKQTISPKLSILKINFLNKIILCYVFTFLFGEVKAQHFFSSSELKQVYLLLDSSPQNALSASDSILGSNSNLSDSDKTHLHIIRSDAYYYLENTYKSNKAMQQVIRLMPFDFPILKKIEVYNSFGQNLASLGEPDSAILIYKKGLDYAKKAKDTIQISNLYYNIGVEHKTKSNFDAALSYLDSAYRLTLIKQDSFSLSHTLRAIGYMNELYYDYEAAKMAYKNGLKYVSSQDPVMECVLLSNLSALYHTTNQLDSCLIYIQKTKECYQTKEDQNTIHYFYKNYAKYYLAKKDTFLAIQMLDSAITKSNQIGDYQEYLANSFLRLSVDSIYRQKIDIKNLLEEAEKRQMKEQLSIGYILYSEILVTQNKEKRAFFYYKKGIELRNEMVSLKNQQLVKAQTIRFEVKEKENQINILKLNNELQKQENKTTLANWIAVFSVLITFLIGLFLFFVYQNKKTQLAVREKQLRQLTEAQSAAFRAQMNPHFIFNSLNSVKGLIVGQQNKEAAIYISKFSKLVRLVLENSQKEVISLQQEIKMVELYIFLEKLRFRDSFEYYFSIEPTLNTETVLIPPVLIQPFVENAIWHAFRNNPRKNTLKIDIQNSSEKLFIFIEDNGVGRNSNQKLEKINSEMKEQKQKSYGIEITKKRINYFGNNFEDNKALKIVDLKDENEIPLGTRIEICLPLKLQKKQN